MSLYLRDDVKIEPLVDRWYAHPFLISPPSAAFMTRHHLQIMESFVQHPELHAMALQQPSMRGGPFLESSLDADVDDVQKLIDFTKSDCLELLNLASEIDDLVELLRSRSGIGLDDIYQKLGPRLAGRVELSYEASGASAKISLIEALIYSALSPRSHQEFAVARVKSDARPYVMSTPRLASRGDLILRMPFASDESAALLSSRDRAVSPRDIERFLEIQGLGSNWTKSQLLDLFSDRPEQTTRHQAGSEPRIDYFGHACVLVHTGRESVLIDPLVGYNVPLGPARSTWRDLPEEIYCALITHAHHDHYVIETLLQIRDKTKNIVVPRATPGSILDPSLELVSRHLGFRSVLAPNPFETIEFQSFKVQTLPFLGEHGDLDITSKLGYRIEFSGHSIIFLADSNNLDTRLYEQIRDIYGATETAFIGLECVGAPVSWTYGPLLFGSVSRDVDQTRRTGGSDSTRALELVRALGCQRVFIYAMCTEPWVEPLGGGRIEQGSFQDIENKKFIHECRSLGIEVNLLDGSKSLTLSID